MSGIGGMMQRAGSPSDVVLATLADSLQHRGPDAVKGEIYNEVGFVYTRLSIIDIEGGAQPLHADNISLIANGEIYNAREVREKYPSYPYMTQSDCESIIPLFRKHGEEFANHLSGMYALALYDDKTKTLYLSRDPFGMKSLYYWEGLTGIAFASEPQALLNAQLVSPQINDEKLYSLLSFNFIWGRDTLFRNIQRVLPGETIVIKKGHISKRLFRGSYLKGPPQEISADDGLLALDKALDQAVATHLISDVPYGIFLSGNIDTSCLLKLMSRHTKDPIKTFSVIFPGDNGEREKILNLAKSFHTVHQEISFDENDFWTLLPRIMEILDDPTLDANALTTYKMAEVASKSVKVLLTGTGAAELFGSQKYEGSLKSWWLGGDTLPKEDKLKKFTFLRIQNDALWQERDKVLINLEKRNLSRLQMAQAIDIESSLPNKDLLKFDRCLMAYGIEGRMPYLDMGVAEMAFNFPDDLKLKDKTPQWLLREWLQKNSPEVIPFLNQQESTLPIGEWMLSKGKEIGPLVAGQEGVKDICRVSEVEKLFVSTDEDAQHFAWGLLCFALWHQIHIMGIPPQEDVITTLMGPQPTEDSDMIEF